MSDLHKTLESMGQSFIDGLVDGFCEGYKGDCKGCPFECCDEGKNERGEGIAKMLQDRRTDE